MTIRANVAAWLDHHGIAGVEFVEERPDRVFVRDHEGRLLEHAITNNWSHGTGDNHTLSTIADTTRGTWREPASPSMQITLHPVHNDRALLEIDFDFSSPARNPFGHLWEVLRNKFTRRTTDQQRIAAGLARRGIG